MFNQFVFCGALAVEFSEFASQFSELRKENFVSDEKIGLGFFIRN